MERETRRGKDPEREWCQREDKDRRGERSLAEGKMAEEPESYKLQKEKTHWVTGE